MKSNVSLLDDGRALALGAVAALVGLGAARFGSAVRLGPLFPPSLRPPPELPLADRLAAKEVIDRIAWLDQVGLRRPWSSYGSRQTSIYRLDLLGGGDGGFVFALPGPRPRGGFLLLRKGGYPTKREGLQLLELEKDLMDDLGQDGALIGHAEWVFQQRVPGWGDLLAPDHPLVQRLLNPGGSGSRVRLGPLLAPGASVFEIQARVRAALERLRDKDIRAVEDAQALLSFEAAAGTKTQAFAANPNWKADFKRAFPGEADRFRICQIQFELDHNGAYAIDESIDFLRDALHLDADFEPKRGSAVRLGPLLSKPPIIQRKKYEYSKIGFVVQSEFLLQTITRLMADLKARLVDPVPSSPVWDGVWDVTDLKIHFGPRDATWQFAPYKNSRVVLVVLDEVHALGTAGGGNLKARLEAFVAAHPEIVDWDQVASSSGGLPIRRPIGRRR